MFKEGKEEGNYLNISMYCCKRYYLEMFERLIVKTLDFISKSIKKKLKFLRELVHCPIYELCGLKINHTQKHIYIIFLHQHASVYLFNTILNHKFYSVESVYPIHLKFFCKK